MKGPNSTVTLKNLLGRNYFTPGKTKKSLSKLVEKKKSWCPKHSLISIYVYESLGPDPDCHHTASTLV